MSIVTGRLLPWTGGSRLITLLDMKKFLARGLVEATNSFAVGYMCFLDDKDLTDKKRTEIYENVESFVAATKTLGLPLTHKSGLRLLEQTKSDNLKGLEELFHEVQSRFDDEAENLPLFCIHQDALKYYNKTDLFGDKFKSSFPTANAEVSEAGNCFAFDRFTACAFHLMRSLEVVLKVLFNALGLPPLTTAGARNWNGILREIKDKLDSDKTIPDHDFYESAYAFLAAAKNPMRNATMHVDAIYDESSARSLFDAVGAFMRHVATKLKE